MARKLIIDMNMAPILHTFTDLAISDCCMESVCISEEKVSVFAALSMDYAPVHFNEMHARDLGYSGRIVHGQLTILEFSRLLGMFLPGPNSVICSIKFDFKIPVLIGSKLDYSVTVSRLSEATRVVLLDLEVKHDNEIFVKGVGQCIMMK